MAKRNRVKLENTCARNIAVNALRAWLLDKELIQNYLNRIFTDSEIEDRQRRLATEITCGVCRHIWTLDYVIMKNSNRPLKKIDMVILQIIRVGLYQQIYMRTPDFASINEAVEQARDTGIKGAGAFVNAILRSVQRLIDKTVESNGGEKSRYEIILDGKKACRFKKTLLPDPNRSLAKYYSYVYSHPIWLLERWLKRYAEKEVRQICLADNARPTLHLRANPLKITNEQLLKKLSAAGAPALINGPVIELIDSMNPQRLPGFTDGQFYVQDAAAATVAPLLEVKPGMNVLDMCAAPGGKTTHLGEIMENKGAIIACDTNRKKLDAINDNCRRLGIEIVTTCKVTEFDAVVGDKKFDAALVDVPCSNTGVLARRAEARHLLKPADIGRNSQLQYELLEKAALRVKETGKVVYSTCSIEPVENELLIERFLAEHSDFKLVNEKLTLPKVELIESADNNNRWSRRDGGYAAVLKRLGV